MPLNATPGQILVNEVLPPEYRDYTRSLAGQGLDDVLGTIARERPEEYKRISKEFMSLGAKTSYSEGTTISVDDLRLPPVLAKLRDETFDHIEVQQKAIEASDATPKAKRKALGKVYAEAHKLLVDKTFEVALEEKNPLALQVLSKARGNPSQLAAMLMSPGSFTDAKGDTLPIFIRRSFAQGLTPAEFYASSFGARQGVVSTKMATMRAGDFGKQLNVAAEGIMVTDEDCGTLDGIPVDVKDADSHGAILARDTGGFELGTPVTGKMQKALAKNHDKVLVRSPTTCRARGGVCKRCVGLREDGKLPALGSAIGTQAASALAERIAQGSLNVKHQAAAGGGKDDEEVYGGFDVVNQIGQVPEAFRYQATLADIDGMVDKIEEAPQGGTNIYVGGALHYVAPDQRVLINQGDELEAGDQISSGIVNPAQVVKYKGIGEGRRYFAERLTQAFKDSKLKANRRNAEIVARGVINHVDVTDAEGVGDFLPGDIASYDAIAANYKPRQGALSATPHDAVGKYLERPALHYTIGTRITKKMAQQLHDFGVDSVTAHDNEPGFTPRMIRLRATGHSGKDWLAKMKGSYLQTNLLQDAQRGSESNIHGTHPVPGLVYGAEFGKPKPGQVGY
jgi:DNA-directed RNA polymerase subunit beta'